MNSEQDKPSATRVASASGRVFDLENRLLEFASVVIDLTENLPSSRAGDHLAGQLLRSGTSPYGNHGEAQAPESAEDFIHKMEVCLKELRESRRWLRLIARKNWLSNDPQLAFLLREIEELVRIFKASVQTAERHRLANRSKGRRSNPKSARGGGGSMFNVRCSAFKVRWLTS